MIMTVKAILLSVLLFSLALTAAAPARAGAAYHPTWQRCVLTYGPLGNFHSKTCTSYVLQRDTRRPIGYSFSQTGIANRKRTQISWPRFAPLWSLPGCPPAIAQWAGYIIPAARLYGLPVPVMTGVMENESRGNPQAYNPSSGAAGLYQFLPSTAAAEGIDPYSPQQATYAAARYIRDHGLTSFSGGGYSSAWGCD